MSLTGIPVPKIAIFENVNKVAITAATNQIYNVNSKNLNRLVGDFVPVEGFDVLPKGLNVLHYAPNSNQDIKNKQNKVAEKVLFRCEIGNSNLKWTSPQKIESHLVKFTSLVWSAPKGVMSLRLKPDTNGIFDGIDYHKNTKTVQVHFNLTQRVPVLQNGLVSLLSTTITLYTLHNGRDGYNGWLLKGTGKETILDELVDVRVNQREHRTNVKAKANIFDMETLRNRTKAECLKPALRKAFLFPQIFPINNLGFEASFEFNKVLKLKGNAHLNGKPKVEILYFIRPSGPQLKVALLFKNEFLHNVVNLFYGEKTMTIEWMRFKTIAVVMKQGGIRGQQYHPFDRNQFENVDKSFDEGIGFGADLLNLKGCIRKESKMCKFLKAQLTKNANFVYYGQMLKGVMRMRARLQWKVTFGKALEFQCSESHMRVKKDGQRLVFGGNFRIVHTSEVFEGKIYDDGTNILMLEFGGKATDESDKILNLGYAKLRPVRAKFPISGKEIDAIRLRSRLYLGTVLNEQIEFSGDTGRQNIWYKKSTSPIVKFVGSKVRLNHKKIFKAFGVCKSQQNKLVLLFEQRRYGYSSSNKGTL
ncbi:uncharacterized protein LOC135680889 isoform X1 [Rhopilema esculentum]|uniref:uncharacterized protein LOC135680889 isoform X1 n=1 Tax=Rhopilema esculentum TaxID=499914 RepID=UPI0031D0931D